MIEQLARYVLAAMIAWVPIEEHARLEPPEVTEARYESIATDIADEALDPWSPVVFDGADGRAKTALLLASIASFESHYAARVDDCREGDRGRAWSIFQLQDVPRWVVCGDRRAAIRIALATVAMSFRECRRLDMLDRLSWYANGVCRSFWPRSRSRVMRALDFLRWRPLMAGGGA